MSRVNELMILLQCSEEEALQVIEDDKRIDRGEDLFPLTAEQKKNAQLYVEKEFGIKATQDEADAICIGKSYVLNLENSFDWN